MQVPNHPTITTNGVLRPTQVYFGLTRLAGAIPCEILININTRVPRINLPITPPENQINER